MNWFKNLTKLFYCHFPEIGDGEARTRLGFIPRSVLFLGISAFWLAILMNSRLLQGKGGVRASV